MSLNTLMSAALDIETLNIKAEVDDWRESCGAVPAMTKGS
jgi:hypothetical protein